MFAFERNGRVGFIDAQGNIVIKPTIEARIEDVGDFSDGLVRVGSKGFADDRGAWVFQRKMIASGDFTGGYKDVLVSDPARKYRYEELILDRTGAVQAELPNYQLHDFSEGLFSFEQEGKPGIRKFEPGKFFFRDYPGLMGFLDTAGKVVIPASFAEVGPFREGLARAIVDGYCYRVTDENFKMGSPTSGFPGDCGGAPDDAVEICKVGFIDHSGQYAIEPSFEAAQDFSEGLAAVRIDGKWGFINRTGAVVIHPGFRQVQPFHEGLAAIRVGDRWGFISGRGNAVISASYDSVQPFSDSLALVTSGTDSFFIDQTGRIAIRGPFREATPFVQGLAAVLATDRRVAYIDKSGNTVFEYTRSAR